VISPQDRSLVRLLRKQFLQLKSAQNFWLELKIKANVSESLLLGKFEVSRTLKRTKNPALKEFLSSQLNDEAPELTEVSIATSLSAENIDFEVAQWGDVFDESGTFEDQLRRCDVIFASTTFLRDLSELIPLIEKIKRPHHKVVIGGALAGTIHNHWKGHSSIDVVAVGYGEFLVPRLAAWIRSDFKELEPPPRGRLERRDPSQFIFSGSPDSLNLDFIERPNWALIEKVRGRKFEMITYESVRGCPYRCAFCNYPYLFDDTKFRTKSAQKMANDWETYKNDLGISYITCLDSLFTMPKARLTEFCAELISRKVDVKWICYARADDLCDESAVQMMVAAGCIQVQIGIESGDQRILNNMNKRTTEETNSKALLNCRKYNLTTVATLIVGFPGETEETIRRTLDFLEASPPDFFFIATFSTRVEGVPILTPESREKFNLVTMNNLFTISPYWSHSTMNCHEAGDWSRWLTRELIRRKISLDAAVFYSSILFFDPKLRNDLLDLQARAWRNSPIAAFLFEGLHRFLSFCLKKDVMKVLKKPVVHEEVLYSTSR